LGVSDHEERHSLPRPSLIVFRQRLYVTYTPGAVTSPPLQGFHLPKKLGGECRFAPETLIAGFAAQAQLHVTHSRLKGTLQDTQLLFVQFKQHRDAPSEPRQSSVQMLPAL
jgi:hypothetical protein